MTGTLDFKLKRGETFSEIIQFDPDADPTYSISGRTYEADLKIVAGRFQEVVAPFTVTITSAADRKITMSIDTSEIEEGEYRYDLKETNGSVISYPLEGKFTIGEPVTE